MSFVSAAVAVRAGSPVRPDFASEQRQPRASPRPSTRYFPLTLPPMDSFKDSVAFWMTVLGTLVEFFGVFQARAWLAVIGALIVVGSIAALAYARRQRELVKSAVLKINGRSIDSLNVAGLRRQPNRSLVVQRVENTAVIDGEDLTIFWKCDGYCRARREGSMEFSIDADANIPFANLDCIAFDLRRDPRKHHAIRPILIGPDGMAKKIAVPFLAPLAAKEAFSVLLKCKLPGCMKAGIDYYTATLSFAQDTVPSFVVKLRFDRGRPRWVRVYECRPTGTVSLLRDLRPAAGSAETQEYVDVDENVPGASARVYLFQRPALTKRPQESRIERVEVRP